MRSFSPKRLALESIEDIQGTRRPIVMRRNLTGWPILFGNSREAWNFAHVMPIEWPWLNSHFGDSEEYRVGLVAHALALNFAEFLSRVRNGPPFDQIRQDREHGPYVPPYYIDENTDVERRAVRMLSRTPTSLSGSSPARPAGVLGGDRTRTRGRIHIVENDLHDVPYDEPYLLLDHDAKQCSFAR